MTEDDARTWLAERWPEDIDRLLQFEKLLRAEAARQNLVSASSLDAIWSRHFVDSAQLVPLAPVTSLPWIDIGTGAGFPGLICALLRPEPFLLVEPRRRRAEFLDIVIRDLQLTSRVQVARTSMEKVVTVAGTVSARAVASISKLLDIAAGAIAPETTCLFPRGIIDDGDVAQARATWFMSFHVEPSLTDAASRIAVISQVKPK